VLAVGDGVGFEKGEATILDGMVDSGRTMPLLHGHMHSYGAGDRPCTLESNFASNVHRDQDLLRLLLLLLLFWSCAGAHFEE